MANRLRQAAAAGVLIVGLSLVLSVFYAPLVVTTSPFVPNATTNCYFYLDTGFSCKCVGSGCLPGLGGSSGYNSQLILDFYTTIWWDLAMAVAVATGAFVLVVLGLGRTSRPLLTRSLGAVALGIMVIVPVTLVAYQPLAFTKAASLHGFCYTGSSPCNSFYGSNDGFTWGPGFGWWASIAAAAAFLSLLFLVRAPSQDPRRPSAGIATGTVAAAVAVFTIVFTSVWRSLPVGSNLWLLPLIFGVPGATCLWLWRRTKSMVLGAGTPSPRSL